MLMFLNEHSLQLSFKTNVEGNLRLPGSYLITCTNTAFFKNDIYDIFGLNVSHGGTTGQTSFPKTLSVCVSPSTLPCLCLYLCSGS